jgi:hypothetical protein
MSYRVEVTVDISYVGRGRGGTGMVPSPMGNVAGVGGVPVGGGPGTYSNSQTMRRIAAEIVPGTFDAPTAANIGTAISTAATDIQAQITAAVLAQIQGWATGSE